MIKHLSFFTVLRRVLISLCIIFALFFVFFFIGLPHKTQSVVWGVNFSQKHSSLLGLDWKKNYLAIVDELKPQRLKLIAHWDIIEPKKEQFSFEDLDWQLEEAGKRGIKVLLVVGMKTPRWPECHIPAWAAMRSKKEQERYILKMLETVVGRYKNSTVIWGWQVENEPFLSFGDCPWQDNDFLKEEIALLRLHDPDRPVVLSGSGEWSSWIREARLADVVATTLYRKVWIPEIGRYVSYPFPPTLYARKKFLIEKFFHTRVIIGELQAEPWGRILLYDLPLTEQIRTMDENQFRGALTFARKTNFDEIYLWGAEWWYWMKEKQGNDFFWDEAARVIHL